MKSAKEFSLDAGNHRCAQLVGPGLAKRITATRCSRGTSNPRKLTWLLRSIQRSAYRGKCCSQLGCASSVGRTVPDGSAANSQVRRGGCAMLGVPSRPVFFSILGGCHFDQFFLNTENIETYFSPAHLVARARGDAGRRSRAYTVSWV
jgi:hypothetical protein